MKCGVEMREDSAVKTIFLFQWDAEAAARRAGLLRAAGWNVEVESEDGARGVRRVLDVKPDLIVFDLAARPSHSRESALAVRRYRAGRYIPMIFVDGREDAVARLKSRIEGAIFTSPDLLLERLANFET
jgi:DNA-binding response OmpR family regulator